MIPSRSHRFLIVNADDFGISPGVNQGIVRAHEHGIVTSTSLMVLRSAAAEAAAQAQMHPRLSIGLHVDLCEWVFADGEWKAAYERVRLDDRQAVAAEVARQWAAFLDLLGREPTHLDSHQHVHRSEPARSVFLEYARRQGIPLRSASPEVRYCGDFYGQSDKGYPFPEGISVEALQKIIRELPAGITELGCHPGVGRDVDSVYLEEREMECRTLCDPRILETLREERIHLCAPSQGAGVVMGDH